MFLRVARCTAGEQVHRGVAIFGPGVDDQVTLGDDGHAGDADGTEGVDLQIQQVDVQRDDHIAQGVLGRFDRIQILAPPHLEDDVTTNRFHGFTSTTGQRPRQRSQSVRPCARSSER